MEKKKCKFCDKVIEGYKKSQVDYLMNQHIIAKHVEKIRIKSWSFERMSWRLSPAMQDREALPYELHGFLL